MTKKEVVRSLFQNRLGVLATMHKKEKVISPILEQELGIKIIVPEGFNSDKFGTFTGDIERMGNQLEAAKHKANGVMDLYNETLAFASEGSFGPHPSIPFVPFNREIVLLIDRKNGMEISGIAATIETNYRHKTIKSFEEAYEFSKEIGFPEHGIVIKVNESSKEETKMIKGIITMQLLKDAVECMLHMSNNGEIYIETDMRALYNPTRMKNIEAATRDLVKNIFSLCPECRWPGFKLIDMKKGLPCSWCKLPTELTLSHRYKCYNGLMSRFRTHKIEKILI